MSLILGIVLGIIILVGAIGVILLGGEGNAAAAGLSAGVLVMVWVYILIHMQNQKKLMASLAEEKSGPTGPDPQELAKAISAAVADSVPKPDAMVDGINSAMNTAMQASSQNIIKAHNDGVQNVVAGLSDLSQKMNGSGGGNDAALKDAISSALSSHADRFENVNQSLLGQLEKIGQAQGSIDKLLRVQQSVDGAIKTVANADEFKKMLLAMRAHLVESAKLLKEFSKPRTITLVEKDIDGDGIPELVPV
ncbi:MAG: hypothetical protein AAF492_31360, partial [Verrucomicrobiota bacterium]